MKNTDDMSMEDILASIRKYVSANNEPSKYDKKIMPSSKSNAKVVPLKEEVELEEEVHDEEISLKKPIMFEKALSKVKHTDKSEDEPIIGQGRDGREINLMKFIKQSLDEKIQKWVEQNLESIVEKRLSAILEKAAAEHIHNLLKDEE